MAARNTKNSSGAETPARRQEKKKLRRGLIVLSIIFVMLAGCAVLIYYMMQAFFEHNVRFTLREVEISSSGYWGKPDNRTELVDRLQLKIKKDNIFALEPGVLRDKLRQIPNIADASVQRILPDKLIIRIEERIPRAFLGRGNSELLIDANGMVISSKHCFGVHPNLPVIVGLTNQNIRPGAVLKDLHNALDLIMQIYRDFPDFRVELVSVGNPERLFFFLRYRKQKRYYVTMPSNDVSRMLDVLHSAIENARQHRDPRSNINLMFDGTVVLSGGQ